MGGGGISSSSVSSSRISSLTSPLEVNVAYSGTFGDLSAAGNPNGFMNDNFSFESFMSEDGAADGMQAPDFTAINGSHATGTTVSPQELFNDSIPPSTSFTNLTTPGSTYLETPLDDFETSPLFNDNLDAANASSGEWYSLFPDAEQTAGAPLMMRNSSSSSGNKVVVHPGGEPNHRKRSSTATSPTFSPAVKHSAVAGVSARRRDKPLPPIMVDEHDTVAMKRARNTAAARKSRAKKVAERDDLEAEIADLKAQVEYWRGQALAGTNVRDSTED